MSAPRDHVTPTPCLHANPFATRTTCAECSDRWDASGTDAGLGVGHVWTAVACPAYRTLNPADCMCGVDKRG